MIEDNEAPAPATGSGVGRWAAIAIGVAAAAGVGFTAGSNRDPVKFAEPNTTEAIQPDAVAAATPLIGPAKPLVDPSTLVRGVIQPLNESVIASRITARITAMPFGEGASFRRGALLARFDCSQTQAQLRAANAATRAYEKTYQTNVELDQYQAVGKNEVAVSQANLGKAKAEAGAVASQLSDCAVYAPFSGKVVEQLAHSREVAASGQPLLKIQSGGALEVELIVPSRWLTWVRPGEAFAFKIDETGAVIKGVVKRLGAAVDPVSKTVRVTGDVTLSDGLILPGMSGTAEFDNPQSKPSASPAPAPAPATPSTG